MDATRHASRITRRKIVKSLRGKVLNPLNWLRAYRHSQYGKSNDTAWNDAQLRLYSRLLPGDFLHYGYFKDPDIAVADITIAMIQQAQLSYAQLILELLPDSPLPVLDVGCGMGGLLKLLREAGKQPVGITPDRYQVQYIRDTYQDVEVLHTRFEEMVSAAVMHKFGCVINSESIQYLELERALEVVDRVLAPQGRWIVADYFRIGDADEKSGLEWESFVAALTAHGFRISYDRDITRNVLPTLECLYTWSSEMAIPALEFAVHKLQRKRPGLYFFLDEIVPQIQSYIREQIEIVNPQTFAANKRYMLLTIERGGSAGGCRVPEQSNEDA